MSFIKSDNKCFNYHGRWESTEKGYVSHWCRPYFEFCVKGGYVELVFDDPRGACNVRIDGKIRSNSGSGTDMLYRFNDDNAHICRVTSTSGRYPLIFKGVNTDGKLLPPTSRKKNYLFIGDSLTESGASYSQVIPNTTDSDYVCIALGGMALCDGRGYYANPNDAGEDYVKEGMESAFYNWQCPVEAEKRTKYALSNEKYDAVFINLGTNDNLISEENTVEFKEKYVRFVSDISGLWQNTPIYLVQPSADNECGLRLNTIEEAAKKAEAQFKNVHFVCSRGWDIELASDGTHPTAKGYADFAAELMKTIGIK